MAYFDSKKNRALWEIELQGLRKEKAERAAGKIPNHMRTTETKSDFSRGVVRTSYKELLREESMASKKASPNLHTQMEQTKKMGASREHQKEGRTHEKK